MRPSTLACVASFKRYQYRRESGSASLLLNLLGVAIHRLLSISPHSPSPLSQHPSNIPAQISLRVSFAVINWSVLSCKRLLRVMGGGREEAAYFLRVKAACIPGWVHYTSWHMSAWIRGERRMSEWAESRSWFGTEPPSPGLMGLFGMPPLLDAEWWSRGVRPFCVHPLGGG